MSVFDAVNHSLTTVSTGGFSTHDASFGGFQGPAEYVAAVFMVLASLPFVRYVQLLAGGAADRCSDDSQVRVFLVIILVAILASSLVPADREQRQPVPISLREATFNIISIITGTGYASADYQLWGSVSGCDCSFSSG